jgi:hypothetical protein
MLAHIAVCALLVRDLANNGAAKETLMAIPNRPLAPTSSIRLLRARYYLPWQSLPPTNNELEPWVRSALLTARITGREPVTPWGARKVPRCPVLGLGWMSRSSISVPSTRRWSNTTVVSRFSSIAPQSKVVRSSISIALGDPVQRESQEQNPNAAPLRSTTLSSRS